MLDDPLLSLKNVLEKKNMVMTLLFMSNGLGIHDSEAQILSAATVTWKC